MSNLPIHESSPLLTAVLYKDTVDACPRCGGEVLKEQYLDKGFVPVIEIRCKGRCGWSKICA